MNDEKIGIVKARKIYEDAIKGNCLDKIEQLEKKLQDARKRTKNYMKLEDELSDTKDKLEEVLEKLELSEEKNLYYYVKVIALQDELLKDK